MPPKKAASGPKTAVKAKAVKRKVEKENPEVDAKEEIVDEAQEKKGKSRGTKKEATAEGRSQPTRKAPSKAVEKEVPEKKPRTTKAAAAKKETTAEVIPNEAKNGTSKKKVTKSKKAKEAEPEKAKDDVSAKKETAAAKKKATAKEKKAAAAPKEKAAEEEPAEVAPKARKRKAPAKAASKKEEPETKTVKNATATDWESINFKCTSKNSKGNLPNFHITSWNVDGLRAWFKKGGLNIVEYDQPDIFCLQETKCSSEFLPDEVLNIEGYETHWASSVKEGYAGVGIASKVKPISVKFGIGSEEHDSEGRCITAEYENFYLINVYVPNAGRKLVTLPKRLEWNNLFKEYVKKLDEVKPVIVCGDMNVAHEEIDLANPKTNTKNAGFTPEERQGMTEFLADGYVDSFRKLYPDQEKAYTFWTYMAGARVKNVGWRLDYFIVSERLMENICDNVIHSKVLGSDHCPISLHFNL